MVCAANGSRPSRAVVQRRKRSSKQPIERQFVEAMHMYHSRKRFQRIGVAKQRRIVAIVAVSLTIQPP